VQALDKMQGEWATAAIFVVTLNGACVIRTLLGEVQPKPLTLNPKPLPLALTLPPPRLQALDKMQGEWAVAGMGVLMPRIVTPLKQWRGDLGAGPSALD
jgi:hypothetical protein